MARSGQSDGVFRLTKYEHWVMCPYDVTHILTNLRIGTHIAKCRKNYIGAKNAKEETVFYGTCRYNYLHRLPEPELEWHQERCPSQNDIVRRIKFIPNPTVPKPEEEGEAAGSSKKFPPDEDWELECSYNRKLPFDPSVKLIQERPCVPKHLLTRTERKEFKDLNRRLKNELYPERNNEPAFKKLNKK